MSPQIRTLADALAAEHASSSEAPCMGYPEKNTPDVFKYYSREDLRLMTRNAAAEYVSQGLRPRKIGERASVVALYALGTPAWAVSGLSLV